MKPAYAPPRGGIRRHRAFVLARLLRQRLRRIGVLFAFVFVVGMVTVYLCERRAPGAHIATLGDAIWFGLVTLSTVGYGDLYPVTAAGRAATGAFIVFTLCTVGLLLTAVSEAILEIKRMEELGLIGTRLRGHVLVLGFGTLSRTAVSELLGAGRHVAMLCEKPDDLAAARALGAPDALFVTIGEATQDVLCQRLNAPEAACAVVAYADDAQNLIATLNLRAVHPRIEIVVALRREELRQTVMASGVTYVATPNELGGRLVASAVFEPQVARLLEDMASGVKGACDLQQRAAGDLAGLSVRQARRRLDDDDGPLLLGLAVQEDGRTRLIPHPAASRTIGRDDTLLVMVRT